MPRNTTSPRVLSATRAHCCRARRTGSVYVAVLGVALIIALAAMTSLHLSRTETEVLTGADQIARAELLSQSAVELAIAHMEYNPEWRDDFDSGVDFPNSTGLSFNSGYFKISLIDADGDLNNDSRDFVVVRGVGRYGEATHVTTVEVEPTSTALTCLAVALHADGQVAVNGANVTTDRMVSSNSNISVSSGAIVGDAWAVGSISGTVTGTKYSSSSPARWMPNSSAVWEYYLNNGTTINMASIPSQTIERTVLSAASNPYGATNPQGIYIIVTGGQTLHIRNARIKATLVVISPAAAVEIESQIHWEPPSKNFPALLVDGSLTMEWLGGTNLSESLVGANFNPAGTPYENVADSDQSDVYPGVIKGLVYCADNLGVTNPCVVQGQIIVEGAASITSPLTIAYGGVPAAFPPPGFAYGSVMRVIPRTWRRTAE